MRNIADFKSLLKSRGNSKLVNIIILRPGSVDCSFLLASRLFWNYLLFFYYSRWNHLPHFTSPMTF